MLQTVNFVVAIIWGLGFIVFFVADLVRSMVLLRTILKRCDQITDGYLMDLMVSIKKDLNLKGGIELYQSGNPGGPFTTGFFNMKIVLPRMDNSDDELAMLLRHLHLEIVVQAGIEDVGTLGRYGKLRFFSEIGRAHV